MKNASNSVIYFILIALVSPSLLIANGGLSIEGLLGSGLSLFQSVPSGSTDGFKGKTAEILGEGFSLKKLQDNITRSVGKMSFADQRLSIKIANNLVVEINLGSSVASPLVPLDVGSPKIMLKDAKGNISTLQELIEHSRGVAVGAAAVMGEDVDSELAGVVEMEDGDATVEIKKGLTTFLNYMTGRTALTPEVVFAFKFALIMKHYLSISRESIDLWAFAQDVGVLLFRLARSKSGDYKSRSIRSLLPELGAVFLEGVSEQLFDAKGTLLEMIDALWQGLINDDVSFPGGLPAPSEAGVFCTALEFSSPAKAKQFVDAIGKPKLLLKLVKVMPYTSIADIKKKLARAKDPEIKEAVLLPAKEITSFTYKPGLEKQPEIGANIVTAEGGCLDSLKVEGAAHGGGPLPCLFVSKREPKKVIFADSSIRLIPALRAVLAIVMSALRRVGVRDESGSSKTLDALACQVHLRIEHDLFFKTPLGKASLGRLEGALKSVGGLKGEEASGDDKAIVLDKPSKLSGIVVDALSFVGKADSDFVKEFGDGDLSFEELGSFLSILHGRHREAIIASIKSSGQDVTLELIYNTISSLSGHSLEKKTLYLILTTIFFHRELFTRFSDLDLYKNIIKTASASVPAAGEAEAVVRSRELEHAQLLQRMVDQLNSIKETFGTVRGANLSRLAAQLKADYGSLMMSIAANANEELPEDASVRDTFRPAKKSLLAVLKKQQELTQDELSRMQAEMMWRLYLVKGEIEKALTERDDDAEPDASASDADVADAEESAVLVTVEDDGGAEELFPLTRKAVQSRAKKREESESFTEVTSQARAYFDLLVRDGGNPFNGLFDLKRNSKEALTKTLSELSDLGDYPSDSLLFVHILGSLVPVDGFVEVYMELQELISQIGARIVYLEMSAQEYNDRFLDVRSLEVAHFEGVELGGGGAVSDEWRLKVARFKSAIEQVVSGNKSTFQLWARYLSDVLGVEALPGSAEAEGVQRLKKLAEHCPLVTKYIDAWIALFRLLGLQVTAADIIAGGAS